MYAKVMKFKVSRSMRKALFIMNSSRNKTCGLQIDKRLTIEDAQKVIEALEG